ncbi:YdcF family protein, partial [Desertihabitans aurantiacus]|uniref:YdcF family protein n=1 Tax=Desertihabitans aurantiacus TaxID=2282477 RepID=UPI0018E51E09
PAPAAERTGASEEPDGTEPADAPAPLPPGLVVTSSYHVLRAAMLARRLGLPAQAVGAPTARYFWPSAVLREYVAVLAEHLVVHVVLTLLVALPAPLLVLWLS